MTVSAPSRSVSKPTFVYGLSAVFLALSIMKVATHEMWRDELAPWALVRESGSLMELIHNLRYSGHPFLGVACTSLLHELTDNPLALQLLNVLIVTTAVLVMARSAPWSALQKTAIAFGYYLFFEYNTIARPYSFGVLFTFLACALLCAPRRRWGLLAAALFLLAQTTVYGVILSAAFYALTLVEWAGEIRDGKTTGPDLLRFAGFSSAVALGALLSVAFMRPPPDSGFAVGWRTEIDPLLIGRSLTRVWRAFVPIPEIRLHFWNTNILDEHGPLQAVLGLLLLLAAGLMLRLDRRALTVWLTGTGGLLLFIYMKYDGYQRHHGHLFLIFLAAWWIRDGRAPAAPDAAANSRTWRRIDHAGRVILGTTLCCQAAAGVFASGMDVVYRFSASRDVAGYIAQRGAEEIVVADADHAGMPVAVWLNRPFYYVVSGMFRIRVEYSVRRRKHVSAAEIYAAAMDQKAKGERGVLLLVNHPVPPHAGFRLLRTFDQAICESEEYALYEVQ